MVLLRWLIASAPRLRAHLAHALGALHGGLGAVDGGPGGALAPPPGLLLEFPTDLLAVSRLGTLGGDPSQHEGAPLCRALPHSKSMLPSPNPPLNHHHPLAPRLATTPAAVPAPRARAAAYAARHAGHQLRAARQPAGAGAGRGRYGAAAAAARRHRRRPWL
jgi:hypothetical protein